MTLHYKTIGQGPALIIIHGLYDNGDNWTELADFLKTSYTVYLPDMRNHGNSDHSDEFGYDVMADDVYELILAQKLDQVTLLGHSMGGRIAMRFAELHAEMVKQLIIVDISPVTVKTKKQSHLLFQSHEDIIKSMVNMPVETIRSYKEADAFLSSAMPIEEIREFLLRNLKKDENQKFYWSINLPSIEKNLHEIIVGNRTMSSQVDCSTLFIKGERSSYLSLTDIDFLEMLFPNMQIETVKAAGHWVQIDNPDRFKTILADFLNI